MYQTLMEVHHINCGNTCYAKLYHLVHLEPDLISKWYTEPIFFPYTKIHISKDQAVVKSLVFVFGIPVLIKWYLYTEIPPLVPYLSIVFTLHTTASHKSNQYMDINNDVPVVHTWISHKHNIHTCNSFIIEQTCMEILGHYMSKCAQWASKHAPLVNWLN